MRTTWPVVIILVLASTMAGSANARNTPNKQQYDTCLCRFGYGNVCGTSIACSNEGGHCVGPCKPPADKPLTNR
jgi:hypothetical protein